MRTITKAELLKAIANDKGSDLTFYLFGRKTVTIKAIANNDFLLARSDSGEYFYPTVLDLRRETFEVDDEGAIALYHEEDIDNEYPVYLNICMTVNLFSKSLD